MLYVIISFNKISTFRAVFYKRILCIMTIFLTINHESDKICKWPTIILSLKSILIMGCQCFKTRLWSRALQQANEHYIRTLNYEKLYTMVLYANRNMKDHLDRMDMLHCFIGKSNPEYLISIYISTLNSKTFVVHDLI